MAQVCEQYRRQITEREKQLIRLKQEKFCLCDRHEDAQYELQQSKRLLVFLGQQLQDRECQIKKHIEEINRLKSSESRKKGPVKVQCVTTTSARGSPRANKSDIVGRFMMFTGRKAKRDLFEDNINDISTQSVKSVVGE